ncbi:unnamed protein product, partial [Cylindrotheca closterium]
MVVVINKICENATRDDNESSDSNTQWNYGRSNNGSHGGQFIQRGHTDDDSRPQGIMLFQLNNYRGIHLDSGSTFHLRTSEHDFKEGTLQGIDGGFHYTSNIQERRLYREGINKVFDSVCKLDTRASDNINSLSNMVKDGFDVFMDTKRENSFFVTRNGITWRFGHRNGLYTLVDEPAMVTAMFHDHARGLDNNDVQGYCALQSVEKNKEGFTNKQVKRANVAQSGYHMMGAPGAELFKLAIR